MGVNGCGWVILCMGGTGNTKTRQAGSIWGLAGQDLGPMAGEISPDIMFWAVWRKVSKMGKWVLQIGSDGCNRVCGHREEQKQGKKRNK